MYQLSLVVNLFWKFSFYFGFIFLDVNNEVFIGVWIGLNDLCIEGDYYWFDGSQVIYEKWYFNELNNVYEY